MLPIVLVLLVATSALAAPSVLLNVNNINEVAPRKSNGNLVGSYLTDNAFDLVDGGDTGVYVQTAIAVANDLANTKNSYTQALAVAQALAILTELANGVPGDACAAANVVNAYANTVRAGNPVGDSAAVTSFIQRLAAGIDSIVLLSSNPAAVRFASGPRGQCGNGGRIYQFEAAWDAILSNVNPGAAGLVNEQYCAAKRLYNSINVRSNNVGAYVTAASLPSVTLVFQRSLEPVARFLSAVASGNGAAAAGAAKQALIRAASSVNV